MFSLVSNAPRKYIVVTAAVLLLWGPLVTYVIYANLAGDVRTAPAAHWDSYSVGVTISSNPALCPNWTRLGHEGDGGWNVCSAPENDGKCVVYSFGINDDFSFDSAASERGCEVHGFDPSVSPEATYNNNLRTFHAAGLGPTGNYPAGTAPFRWPGTIFMKDGNSEEWALMSISDIQAMLGHDKISVLKVDVEGAEWFGLLDLLSTGKLDNGSIRELVLEFHFDPAVYRLASANRGGFSVTQIAADNMNYIAILEALGRSKMRLWKWQWNYVDNQCIEASFVYDDDVHMHTHSGLAIVQV
jgi:hypothetical protein